MAPVPGSDRYQRDTTHARRVIGDKTYGNRRPEANQNVSESEGPETWLRANHARDSELWLKIHKKGSGLPSVTPDEAIDAALCWGWIDGLRKGFDEQSFLQRFTPRGARSVWSQINRDRVARLSDAGRMTPHGPAARRCSQGGWQMGCGLCAHS